MKRTLTLAALSFLAISAHAQFINYTTAGTIASQNFDSLAASGSSNTFNQGTTINGFYAFRSYLTSGGGSNNSTYAADGGTGNAGNFYSYGTSTQTERAWGAIGSTATGTMVYGFAIQNLTGQTLTQFRLDYFGEQWRKGGETVAQTVTFDYRVTSGAGFTDNDSLYTKVAALDFSSPVNTAGGAALDGNAAANRVAIGSTVTGLTWNANDVLILRWVDANHNGSDAGLAIDDISFEAVPEPFTMSALALGLAAIARKRSRKS
jgi:hypothetical protein